MVIAFIIIALLLSVQINGVVDLPWWIVVVSCFLTFVVGMITSGFLEVGFEVKDE